MLVEVVWPAEFEFHIPPRVAMTCFFSSKVSPGEMSDAKYSFNAWFLASTLCEIDFPIRPTRAAIHDFVESVIMGVVVLTVFSCSPAPSGVGQ